MSSIHQRKKNKKDISKKKEIDSKQIDNNEKKKKKKEEEEEYYSDEEELPRPSVMHYFAQMYLFFVFLVILGLVGIFLYNVWAIQSEEYMFKATSGMMVDVGGYNMHIYCLGGGRHIYDEENTDDLFYEELQDDEDNLFGEEEEVYPTVIFDSSLGSMRHQFHQVVPSIVQRGALRLPNDTLISDIRVCTYDRAGYGFSDAPPTKIPRTHKTQARELHQLLKGAGEEGPFIIVGHGHGAINALAFTHLFPEEVKGLLLTDPDVSLPRRAQESVAKHKQVLKWYLYASPWLARVGLIRLINNLAEYFMPTLPDSLRVYRQTDMPFVHAVQARSTYWTVVQRETLESNDAQEIISQAQHHNNIEGRWRIPMLIISPQVFIPPYDKLSAMITGLQKKLGHSLSAFPTHWIADGSTKNIPTDTPDAIVEALLLVYNKVQNENLNPTGVMTFEGLVGEKGFANLGEAFSLSENLRPK